MYQTQLTCGQHTKMCNQIVLAGTIIGVCESLLYGYKAGLDLDTMLSSITKGAAQCWISNARTNTNNCTTSKRTYSQKCSSSSWSAA